MNLFIHVMDLFFGFWLTLQWMIGAEQKLSVIHYQMLSSEIALLVRRLKYLETGQCLSIWFLDDTRSQGLNNPSIAFLYKKTPPLHTDISTDF